jgi:SAM-dependent methyltransferase
VVGDQRASGGPAPRLNSGMRAAYDAAASGWNDGPGPMYADLAQALVANAGMPVAGRRVLDLGAGTGVAGRAAAVAGARQVVAADIALGMLRRCDETVHPVAADAGALPFGPGSFDLVIAAFCLGHLAGLPGCLAEIRRVGAAVAASSFAPGWTHPAKEAVDAVLADFGYRAPGWYQDFKQDTEPRAADVDGLVAQARAAGFAEAGGRRVDVVTSVATPAQLASWRLGMAHVAPFARTLTPPDRAALRIAAETAVARTGAGALEVTMLVLAG